MKIANDVIDCISMDCDIPSKNGDGKLPILDMKVWTDNNGEVMYRHYEKAVSNKTVIHAPLAHPAACKISVHLQEIISRLLNSAPSLEW